MVRTARFAFDDHRDGRRFPVDDLDAEWDDACGDTPPAEPVSDQDKSGHRADKSGSILSDNALSTSQDRSARPNRAA